jgi:hypothetical protein
LVFFFFFFSLPGILLQYPIIHVYIITVSLSFFGNFTPMFSVKLHYLDVYSVRDSLKE